MRPNFCLFTFLMNEQQPKKKQYQAQYSRVVSPNWSAGVAAGIRLTAYNYFLRVFFHRSCSFFLFHFMKQQLDNFRSAVVLHWRFIEFTAYNYFCLRVLFYRSCSFFCISLYEITAGQLPTYCCTTPAMINIVYGSSGSSS